MSAIPTVDAAQTNSAPTSTSGLLTPSATATTWAPQTILSALPKHSQPSTSPTTPVPFLHLLSRLKTTKREGWRRFGIVHGESIADHMYRMSIITMLAPPSLSSRLDVARCTRMALIHDMAESLVGDITPVDGVPKAEKSRREAATMDLLCGGLLGRVAGGIAGEEMRKVWQEYEDGETLEARFVHDVDKMELVLQMVEYEREHNGRLDLSEFAWVAKRIVLPEVREWCDEVLKEREAFWSSVGLEAGAEGLSEERRAQQDEYYVGGAEGVNGHKAA